MVPILIGSKNLKKINIGNPGDIADPGSSAILRALLHYERLTIGKAENSLLGRLEKEGINPADYLMVLGLRTHGLIHNRPVTEMIYVHSKIIIVDDIYALIGSANINDRSMVGYRDSELAVNRYFCGDHAWGSRK